MGVPFIQQLRVGAYVLGKRLGRVERYPLVLMLEPLFRCNLACPGCGKIDYEDRILNMRLSVEECLEAVDECGATRRLDPRGRAPGDPGHRRRHRRQEEVRLPLHERAADGKAAPPVHPLALPHLLGAPGRAQGASRPCGRPGRGLRARRLGHSRRPGSRLPGQCQLHPLRSDDRGGRGRVLRLRHPRARRRGHHHIARLRVRARARPGALPFPAKDQTPVPRDLQAGRGGASGGSATRFSSSTSSPATSSTGARRGAIRPATSSAGNAPVIFSPRDTPVRSKS